MLIPHVSSLEDIKATCAVVIRLFVAPVHVLLDIFDAFQFVFPTVVVLERIQFLEGQANDLRVLSPLSASVFALCLARTASISTWSVENVSAPDLFPVLFQDFVTGSAIMPVLPTRLTLSPSGFVIDQTFDLFDSNV
jgi:hypothetical protein